MLTPSGKPFEPGTRGFWKDYPNMNALVAELNLRENEVFTPFLGSAFYSPEGLEATAPVFGDAPELPSPLGQVLATFDNFKRLPVADRTTMAGLLLATLDLNRDPDTFKMYDNMSADELFRRAGLSDRLVKEFVAPTLQVGLFKPPNELSAAVAMELLYFYALAHQTAFDVRWIKKRSIAELLIAPLAERLIERHNLDVRAKCFVRSIDVDDATKKVTSITYADGAAGGEEKCLENVDAVVLALGAKGMKAVVGGSPKLAKACPELCKACSLNAIDVLACRIWLDKYVDTLEPANVLSRFEGLLGAGGTFFMLDQLQKDDEQLLWGDETPQGSVVACDIYDSAAVATMGDDEIVNLFVEELLPAAVPEFKGARVVDSYVKRFPGAVSWFSPGSFEKRPPLKTTLSNVVCAGDWVRMDAGSTEHGSKGLCQERALVSGYKAGNVLLSELGFRDGQKHPVIPIRDDEPQFAFGQSIAKSLGGFGIQPPWLS